MSYQLELRHIKYFLAVADTLHFRKAAETLFISQPGLSRQIKDMENNLGVKLFDRHNRDVKLTHVGLYLKLELTKNIKNLESILHHAKLLEDGKDGQLNFGFVGSAMQQIIPELLLKFTKNHPNILFSLKEMDNQKQIEELIAQNIDIGFVRLERIPKMVESFPILKEFFCLVLPKNHPINATNFKKLSQLKDEHFILFDPEYSASYYEKVMDIFQDSGFSPLVSHNTIHAGSIYKLVENGFGISIVPNSLKLNENSLIKFIDLDKISQRTVLSVVWNKNNTNPILEKFLEYVK
ncbi:MAG: LysR family transcriptional regulator [Flavobacteriales bacterium]|nr:LysR family transcriptional regulator [Flavobacteriia bacterium]NCP05534.1 LysR family transcriptional regulator [Flavobacteriales bacterium]PIV93325.1 MAG: transcriptional regulator [Flavobacteriaceae bacterium CG17_big_fil_post_rev_8_21_14_2_50_33_15]PIY10195.1 MAG: transcriptional regulator [Flavobacteriaceae bacterium CG_4_10_14_3_um_filter_33_47]PJB18225.1 MAG: transcriptional regulator [Flavobacteriaceae bacterium CG_4_9_14_3_um_filter_33_16]